MSTRAGQLLLVALLAFGAILAAPTPALARAPLKVGDLPPSTLWDQRLSDYRGKIVIITFWASWCPPCRKELPVLAAIQQQATRDKLVVFAVNWRDSESRFRNIRQFLHQQGVDITLLYDPTDFIGRDYDVTAIPHMIIIGRDGRIAAIHVGYSESEIPVLAKEINSLWTPSADSQGEQAQTASARSAK